MYKHKHALSLTPVCSPSILKLNFQTGNVFVFSSQELLQTHARLMLASILLKKEKELTPVLQAKIWIQA